MNSPTFTLYYRESCHLCEDVATELERRKGQLQYQLEAINIDAYPALKAHYNVDVPVLVVGPPVLKSGPALLQQTIVMTHFFDEQALLNALDNSHAR